MTIQFHGNESKLLDSKFKIVFLIVSGALFGCPRQFIGTNLSRFLWLKEMYFFHAFSIALTGSENY